MLGTEFTKLWVYYSEKKIPVQENGSPFNWGTWNLLMCVQFDKLSFKNKVFDVISKDMFTYISNSIIKSIGCIFNSASSIFKTLDYFNIAWVIFGRFIL